MASKGTYTHYTGDINSLPPSASNGLKFLAQFLRAVDALDDTSSALPLSDLVAPDAKWITNGADPMTTQDVQTMFSSRETMLSAFSHTLSPVTAFHLVAEDGKHTLICESTSKTVFRADPSQTPVECTESHILELEEISSKVPIRSANLQAKTIRACLDPSAIQAKAKALFGPKEG